MEKQAGFVETDGARLYYETAGTGAPLVLIHAGIADRRMWDEQFVTFARHYRVLRFDARGYGESAAASGDASPEEDLERVLQALGIAQAALVGCSRGGTTALDFALDHPGMVASLILVAAVPSGYNLAGEIPAKIPPFMAAYQQRDFAQAAEWAAQIWFDGPNRQPAEMNAAQRAWVRDMMRDVLATGAPARDFARPATHRAVDQLSALHVPALVIVGDQDDPSILSAGEVLASEIPGAETAVIHGAAHLPNIEKPEAFDRLVLDFLQRHA